MREKMIGIAYNSYVKVNNKIYFSHMFLNGLFEIDLNNFCVRFIDHFSGFPKYGPWTTYLHSRPAAIYKKKIFFFPCNGRLIHSYDMDNGVIEDIPIPLETPVEVDRYFVTAYTYIKNNKVWLFPRVLSKGVFILDMDNQSIEKDIMLSRALSGYKSVTNFVETAYGKLYTYSIADNALIEFTWKTGNIKEYKIQIENLEIGIIDYFNDKFWFADKRTGTICQWGLGDQKANIFMADDLEWISSEGMPFGAFQYLNDRVYLIPCRSKYIMKVDENTGKIVKAVDYPADFSFSDKYAIGAFSRCLIVRDEIWLHPTIGNQLLIYDTQSNQIFGKELSIEISHVFSYEGEHKESEMFSLEFLCHTVKRNEVRKQQACYGEKIYSQIGE